MPDIHSPLTRRALVINAVKKTDRIKAIEHHLVVSWGLSRKEASRHAESIFSSIETILTPHGLCVEL